MMMMTMRTITTMMIYDDDDEDNNDNDDDCYPCYAGPCTLPAESQVQKDKKSFKICISLYKSV